MAGFFERLAAAVERTGSRLCVGLDPDIAAVPVGEIAARNRRLIEATSDLVCCYKPNIAFYEARGAAGMTALRETLAAIPPETPFIIDAKRGDIGSTAAAYAAALFDDLGASAVTVNPYLGEDSLQPFLCREDRGVFIVCRTSNPGGGDLQDLPVVLHNDTTPLYLAVAERAQAWNRRGNVGLVTGSTYPRELAQIRERCPGLPLLIPGIGAQGGALEASVQAAANGRADGFIVSASRGVAGAAGPGEDLGTAARAAAIRLRDGISAALPMAARG